VDRTVAAWPRVVACPVPWERAGVVVGRMLVDRSPADKPIACEVPRSPVDEPRSLGLAGVDGRALDGDSTAVAVESGSSGGVRSGGFGADLAGVVGRGTVFARSPGDDGAFCPDTAGYEGVPDEAVGPCPEPLGPAAGTRAPSGAAGRPLPTRLDIAAAADRFTVEAWVQA
jgi:hypothetical protein